MNKKMYEELSNLGDEEFVRVCAKMYEKVLADRNDNDYAINQTQWIKLLKVLKFFLDLAKKSNGIVEPCELMPREEHGGVTASFTVLDVRENDIAKFCDALRQTSAITIDATLDNKICISVTVPDVFRKKDG